MYTSVSLSSPVVLHALTSARQRLLPSLPSDFPGWRGARVQRGWISDSISWSSSPLCGVVVYLVVAGLHRAVFLSLLFNDYVGHLIELADVHVLYAAAKGNASNCAGAKAAVHM
jgi:hypothetical protein